ncbi:MAG: hypothetical protein AAF658_02915 [Myxococcota bacterium]
MDNELKRYLAEIGRRGGRKSRRTLSRGQAQAMVRLREARRAYRRFHPSCFWSNPADLHIQVVDIPWVAQQLMTHGGREGWRVGSRLCR